MCKLSASEVDSLIDQDKDIADPGRGGQSGTANLVSSFLEDLDATSPSLFHLVIQGITPGFGEHS